MSSQENKEVPPLRQTSLQNIEFDNEGEEAEARGDIPDEEDGAPMELGNPRGYRSEQNLIEIGEEEEYSAPANKGKVAIRHRPRQSRQIDHEGEEVP